MTGVPMRYQVFKITKVRRGPFWRRRTEHITGPTIVSTVDRDAALTAANDAWYHSKQRVIVADKTAGVWLFIKRGCDA